MLIENNQLNVHSLKEIFNELSWVKYPRKLNENHTDYFYVGMLDNDIKRIKINVKPNLEMQIEETFKNMTLDGQVPPPEYKGRLCEWGTTVQVIIDETFLDQVKLVSSEFKPKATQKITW